jgi:hypothetical protein
MHGMAWRGWARQGRLGGAGHGKAGHGMAGKARRGTAWQARRGVARQGMDEQEPMERVARKGLQSVV